MTLGFLVELNKAEYKSQIASLQLISSHKFATSGLSSGLSFRNLLQSHASNA